MEEDNDAGEDMRGQWVQEEGEVENDRHCHETMVERQRKVTLSNRHEHIIYKINGIGGSSSSEVQTADATSDGSGGGRNVCEGEVERPSHRENSSNDITHNFRNQDVEYYGIREYSDLGEEREEGAALLKGFDEEEKEVGVGDDQEGHILRIQNIFDPIRNN